MKQEKEQNIKKTDVKYEVLDIPKEHYRTIYDSENEKQVDIYESLAIIMNDLKIIKDVIKG